MLLLATTRKLMRNNPLLVIVLPILIAAFVSALVANSLLTLFRSQRVQ